MTTKNPKNENPNLVDIFGADVLNNMKRDVQKMTNKAYQPMLDLLSERVNLKHTTATVVSVADLELVVKDGQPTVRNNFSLSVQFSPAETDDAFEYANRVILRDLFTRTVEK